jgi:aspartokinase-like uncharacterized kinase
MAHDQHAPPVVIKVGGSLYDLPDLGPRLAAWLGSLVIREVILVPGGGPTTDAVRELDRRQGLGETRAHWLALFALALNARFLAHILPGGMVATEEVGCRVAWRGGQVPVLDAYAFAQSDEGRPGCLPHSWHVTSDSIAARAAVRFQARQLILLKSATLPAGTDWTEAGRCGFVDRYFATALGGGLEVRAVNFREGMSGMT